MKIVHVCAGLEATNGAAVIAAGFARAEAQAGHEVVFAATSSASAASAAEVDLTGVRRVVWRRSRLPVLRALCFSFGMLRHLPRLCRGADVVNVHCAWTFPVWWGAFAGRRAKLVVTPEGSFDPVRLAFSAWKKRLVGPLERLCLRCAALVHATVPVEADWVRTYEPRVRRVAVIPPGVDEPSASVAPVGRDGPLRLLYLGRIHPLKGLDLLEEAVKGLPVELRIESAAFGEAKERAFAWCDALVLPTRSENFGLVIAEALVHARPVVTTTGAPWDGIVAHRCGWRADVSAAALRQAIEEAIRLKPTGALADMGERGRAWMRADYAWTALSARRLGMLA